ncbi:helix-turn-helix domain-containing protein [Pediococcus siamensis]|uniref:helix-turn-helix domain-containing protein n=1 Tax=Pediococcus siamensis TaxID=381829 RepID=UPI00399F184A
MSLGSSLKQARKNCGFTQETVAKILYVTRQTVSRWEQNKTIPNIYVLKDLSAIYGLSIDDLISETKAQIQKDEEEKSMKKINWLALTGVILFNVLLFSSGAITVVALLGSLWIIAGTFIVSPVFLLVGLVTGTQPNLLLATVLDIFIFIIGLFLYPLAKKATHTLINFFRGYIKYNLRTIYR